MNFQAGAKTYGETLQRDLRCWLTRRAKTTEGWKYLDKAGREHLRHRWAVEFLKEHGIVVKESNTVAAAVGAVAKAESE
jgi:hypothetical protein